MAVRVVRAAEPEKLDAPGVKGGGEQQEPDTERERSSRDAQQFGPSCEDPEN
jgi:hypothetical protein